MGFKIHCDWKDQGYGNRKGRLRVSCGNKSITYPFVAEHRRTKVAWHVDGTGEGQKEFFAHCASCKEPIEFRANIGGGGGHALYLKGIEGEATFAK